MTHLYEKILATEMAGDNNPSIILVLLVLDRWYIE